MKWLLAGLCIIAVATTPAEASANTEGEAMSPEPIVIAYIPEHLQHRVPGHQHDVDPVSAQPVSVEPPTSEGLVQTEWWEEERRERNRRIGVAVGVSIAVVAVGVGVGVGTWKAFENSFESTP
jgi:hypothetical protein